MELSRKFGIAIVFGIPAIVGSGFFWALSEKWIVVYGYLFLLVSALVAFLFTPRRIFDFSQFWEDNLSKLKGVGSKLRKPFSGL